MATTLARIEFRRKTAAQWTSSNEVLLASEPGVETDTGKWKFGDGTTAWSALPYQAPTAASLTATYLPLSDSSSAFTFGKGATSLQAAIDATPANGTLWLPSNISLTASTTINISNPITIVGYKTATITWTGGGAALLNITSSNVTLDGLRLVGPGATSSVSGQRAIRCVGTVGSYIANLRVVDSEITGFGESGAFLQFVTGTRFLRNNIHDHYYAGVQGLSVSNSVFLDNDVASIGVSNSGGVGSIGYGIMVTHAYTDSLATNPRSQNVLIAHNRVSNVPNWEGLDTHAGQNIKFLHNTVTGCYAGIVATRNCLADGTTESTAPLDVLIEGNTVSNLTGASGAVRSGIVVQGAGPQGSPVEYATGIIGPNLISGHGDDTNSNDGAIYLHTTRGLRVSGVKILEPRTTGVNVYFDNLDFEVNGVQVTDPWTNTGGITATAVRVRSTNNSGRVVNSKLLRGTKTASVAVAAYGLRVDQSTVTVKAVGNDFTPATVAATGGSGVITGPVGTRSWSVFKTAMTTDGGSNSTQGTAPNVYATLSLADAATQGAYFGVRVPADVRAGSPLQLAIHWTSGSTESGTTVQWSIAAVVGNTSSSSAYTTTVLTGTSAAKTAGTEVVEAATQILSTVNPGDRVNISIRRLGADAADTYASTVKLIEAELIAVDAA